MNVLADISPVYYLDSPYSEGLTSKRRWNHILLATMSSTQSPTRSPAPAFSNFPQNPEEFDADSRVSFSKLANKFILEADNGEEFEFDDTLKRWVPVVRPHPLRIYEGAHASYGQDGGF